MSTLLLCLIPVLFMPLLAKLVFPHKIQWLEMVLILAAGVILTAGIYAAGTFQATADVEILNGEVTSKKREHGEYTRTYDCNCVSRTVNGVTSRTCQTCSEQRYTVEWNVFSNIGSFEIDSEDSAWKSVYNKADPPLFARAQNGDPVAKRHKYTNFIKAAPDSLIRAWDIKKYGNLIPPYPSDIYNVYNINRALAVDVAIPDIDQWNKAISNMLKILGPQRQANVVVVFTKLDQSYLQAIEGKWLGGKKNDIVVVIGTSQYPQIDWVGVASWTPQELFKVQLRDSIVAVGVVDRDKIINQIQAHTLATFKRREMKDFEYLQYQIEPPTWALILAIISGIVTSLGLSYFFYHNDLRRN